MWCPRISRRSPHPNCHTIQHENRADFAFTQHTNCRKIVYVHSDYHPLDYTHINIHAASNPG
jgi:hypothetical protein